MDLFESRNLLNEGKSIYELPLRVTYYARVSTDKDEQLHSLSAQVSYYTDFIKKNPNWTLVDGYIDEGISGTSVNKRDSFLKMIADARIGKFDFIITKEISRFSRSTLDSIKYTQELLSAGVGVLFQNDNINTLHADSELRLTIMSSIAQDEVRKLSERVRFGLKRSIENGVVLGSNIILGYKKDKGKLVIVEEEAEVIRHIFYLYANENMGFRGVADWLAEHGYFNNKGNKFGCSTLRRVITNPKYKGYYCGGKSQKYDYRHRSQYFNSDKWITYKDEKSVPPIISEELWEKANDILQKRSEQVTADDRTSYQNKYPYSGKIRCMEHNTPYYHGTHTKTYPNRDISCFWRCRRKGEGKDCACPIIYTRELDEIMKYVMQNVFSDRKKIVSKLLNMYMEAGQKTEIISNIQKLKGNLSEINKKKDKLLDLSLDGRINNEEFQICNDALNTEAKSIEVQIKDYENQNKKNQEIIRQTKKLRNLITNALTFEDVLNEGVISELLDRIEIHATNDKNKINLRVFLKVTDSFKYSILRERGKPSTVLCGEIQCSPQSVDNINGFAVCTRTVR